MAHHATHPLHVLLLLVLLLCCHLLLLLQHQLLLLLKLCLSLHHVLPDKRLRLLNRVLLNGLYNFRRYIFAAAIFAGLFGECLLVHIVR